MNKYHPSRIDLMEEVIGMPCSARYSSFLGEYGLGLKLVLEKTNLPKSTVMPCSRVTVCVCQSQ